MGNQLIFNILPFNPTITPNASIQLPIDVQDLAHQLQVKWPKAEIQVDKTENGTRMRFYITTEKYGPWIVASFTDSYFYVSGWPRRMAKELIFWYRQYVSADYPLYLIIPT